MKPKSCFAVSNKESDMTTATENIVDARFELDGAGELEVHNVAGRITVRAGDPGVITVHAVLHGTDAAIENTRIDSHQHGDRVVVRTEKRNEQGWIDELRHGSMASVDYDLTVPRGCTLELHGVSANLDASGTGADADLHAISGSVRLEDAAGRIAINTVSGSITASRLNGTLKAGSTSGHITVRESELAPFSLNTVSGGMTIETSLAPDESYSVSTVSGSLDLTVPEGTGITARLSSVSGSVHSDIPGQTSRGPGHSSWSGSAGDGRAHLTMHSVSGSLRLHARA
jgi:hypothetical protein